MVDKIIIKDDIPKLDKCVACIGNFDGVHLGHQKLIEKTISESIDLNCKAVAICFDPSPYDVITGKKNTHILSLQNKINVLKYYGIEQVYIIKFSKELMNQKPEYFINKYLNKLNIKKLICGFDFSFGKHGLGNPELLKAKGKFETIVIDEYKYAGKKVSSSRIREQIIKGNFKLSNKLLGMDYTIELIVENCVKKGSKWLVETKCKDKYALLPKNDTYGHNIKISDNKITIIGNEKLPIGQLILLSFSNYE